MYNPGAEEPQLRVLNGPIEPEPSDESEDELVLQLLPSESKKGQGLSRVKLFEEVANIKADKSKLDRFFTEHDMFERDNYQYATIG